MGSLGSITGREVRIKVSVSIEGEEKQINVTHKYGTTQSVLILVGQVDRKLSC